MGVSRKAERKSRQGARSKVVDSLRANLEAGKSAGADEAGGLAAAGSRRPENPDEVRADRYVREVSVLAERTRMWHLHDRMALNEALVDTLADNIRRHGQHQPALGWELARPEGGVSIELVYGRRRREACARLGVPLRVQLIDFPGDRRALELMDVENSEREAPSPYEVGTGYRRRLDDGLFASQSELAEFLGMNRSTLNRYLKVSALPREVFDAFADPAELTLRYGDQLQRTLAKAGDQEMAALMEVAARATQATDRDDAQTRRYLMAAARGKVEAPCASGSYERRIEGKGSAWASVRRSDAGNRWRIELSPDVDEASLRRIEKAIARAIGSDDQ